MPEAERIAVRPRDKVSPGDPEFVGLTLDNTAAKEAMHG